MALSFTQSARLRTLCKQYFTISNAPLKLEKILALIRDDATCYGNKGRENLIKGFKNHYDKYPFVSYQILDYRTGKDSIGEWVECDFIRSWNDKESGDLVSVNSKEQGFTERLRFDQNDLIIEITKYNVPKSKL